MQLSVIVGTKPQYEWQTDPSIVGALEVPSEPHLNCRTEYIEHPVDKTEKEFQECMGIWYSLNLKPSFVEACEAIPPTRWLGMIPQQKETLTNTVATLRKGWEHKMNVTLKKQGIKISCFASSSWGGGGTGRAHGFVFLIRFQWFNSIRRLHQFNSDPHMVEDALLTIGRIQDGVANKKIGLPKTPF